MDVRTDDEAATREPFDEAHPKTVEQLRAQSAALADDLKELGRLTRELAGEKVEEARQGAKGLYEQSRRKTGDLEDQVVAYVRDKPMKSLLIAAGLGAVIGMLWTRR